MNDVSGRMPLLSHVDHSLVIPLHFETQDLVLIGAIDRVGDWPRRGVHEPTVQIDDPCARPVCGNDPAIVQRRVRANWRTR